MKGFTSRARLIRRETSLDPIPRSTPYRPSVDAFFSSAAQHWHNRSTGVLLTGMGRDGAEGLSALRVAGWHTIAQDEETCVVFGMPKAALALDAAVEVLPLPAIGPALAKHHRVARPVL